MLTRIDLQRFKCFNLLKLPLRPLTLLSGINASGKSSVIQALGLLHQTMREHPIANKLVLDGGAVRLGTVEDVIDKIAERLSCTISLEDNETMYKWEFEGDWFDKTLKAVSFSKDDELHEPEEWYYYLMPRSADLPDRHLISRLCRLVYLSAERMGPRDLHPLQHSEDLPMIESAGEYAIAALYSGRNKPVADVLTIDNIKPTRSLQVEARMGEFFPGFEMTMTPFPNVNSVKLGIRTSKETSFLRPIHTGFGITQVLPIVVAALSADRGDLLLIESPEAHLHPGGQAKMGEFLSEVAAAGVQVILETHSDHVLNGVRRAVKNGQLPADDAILHFFRPRHIAERDSTAQVQSLHLDSEGNVDDWPEGFFDQFDKDMNYFAGWC